MRIISGTHGGRKIYAPKKLPVRPTTDFAKEALFNILSNRYDLTEISALDLCAGTGNISYEFISRGAINVTAVEQNAACSNFINKTSKQFNFNDLHCNKSEAIHFLKRTKAQYDIIFADPPYASTIFEDVVKFAVPLLKENGCLVVEHSAKTPLSHLNNFKNHRKYGNVNFSIFSL